MPRRRNGRSTSQTTGYRNSDQFRHRPAHDEEEEPAQEVTTGEVYFDERPDIPTVTVARLARRSTGYSFFFSLPSFSLMNVRMSSAMSRSFTHCS